MNLSGVYRASIEDTADPERRHRYRVRVMRLHPVDAPVAALPWAETAVPQAAQGSSDAPVLRVGDVVWIAFEDGHRDYPVIVGACFTSRQGVMAGAVEVASDYNVTRQRWRRQDRALNSVELSEEPSELHVRIASGSANITVSQRDNAITMSSTDGPIEVMAEKVLIDAISALVKASAIRLAADATEAGVAVGEVEVWGSDKVQIHAPKSPTGEGLVRIGQVVNSDAAPPQILQSSLVQLLAEVVEVGSNGAAFTPTLRTKIAALQEVLIECGSDVAIDAIGNLRVKTKNDVLVQCRSADVQAVTSIKVTAGTDITLKATTVNIVP